MDDISEGTLTRTFTLKILDNDLQQSTMKRQKKKKFISSQDNFLKEGNEIE